MKSNIANKTRCKILEVAKKLFSKNGIDGTSIRDISSMAKVNLSAINYHFKNKENLYKESFNEELIKLNTAIEKIGENSRNLPELSYETFLYFKNNGELILFLFHAFTNLDLDASLFNTADSNFGPPGQSVFFKQINIDLNKKTSNVTLKQKNWACRIIIGSIMHFSLSLQSPVLKNLEDKLDFLDNKNQEESIKNLASAIFNFL